MKKCSLCSWCTSENKIHFNDLDELVNYITTRTTKMNYNNACLFAIRMTTIKLYQKLDVLLGNKMDKLNNIPETSPSTLSKWLLSLKINIQNQNEIYDITMDKLMRNKIINKIPESFIHYEMDQLIKYLDSDEQVQLIKKNLRRMRNCLRDNIKICLNCSKVEKGEFCECVEMAQCFSSCRM